MTQNSIESILLFALISLVTLIIGWKSSYFSSLFSADTWKIPIQWTHVVFAFAIYFGISAIGTPFIGHLLHSVLSSHPTPFSMIQYASLVNTLNSGTILVCLLIFLSALPRPLKKGIWKDQRELQHSYKEDLHFVIFSWVIAFPLVIFINQILDWTLSNVFHVPLMPEQIAVYFLKMTFGHPLYLSMAILTIVFFAPIVEELLFRGFLQSFIRKQLGSKQAIFITSLLFAFFHYSKEQGLANLTIIVSLFTLSLFIGFSYEKRKCLFTPIVLHALFNAVNVCNLYFLGEIYPR